MRPVRVVGFYLACVFLGGALIAPWVHGLVQVASGVVPGMQSLAAKPFPRYVNRSLLILAVVGLWPFLRATELSSWRAIGLGRRPDALGQLGRGFEVGLVSLACVVLIVVGVNARQMSHGLSGGAVLLHFLKAGISAIVVAPLEEIFFRGALFGALRKTFHWAMALVLSSSVYALLHFLERPEGLDKVGWGSGFAVLFGMVGGFSNAEKLIPGFLNLALVGMILGLAYERSGSLHFSIGLHAGWIFWLKTYGFVTQQIGPQRAWFFGTDKLIDGWLAFLVLAAVFVLMSRFMVHEDPHAGWKGRGLLS